MPTKKSPQVSLSVINRISAFDELPNSALLSMAEISSLASRSHPSIWRDVKAGRLPAPIKLGPTSARWLVSDIRRYLVGQQMD
jgi:predicted DNA-binding transcriptional regulator AlpA